MLESEDSRNLALLVQKVDALNSFVRDQLKDHEDRLRDLEAATTRLSERLTTWQVAQGVYATVAGVVATMLGRIR